MQRRVIKLFGCVRAKKQNFLVFRLSIRCNSNLYRYRTIYPRPRDENKNKDVDIAIIGGGFGGAWAAKKITELRPTTNKLSIALFERSNRIGGRLYSDDPDLEQNILNEKPAIDHDHPVQNELGGMRIFPEFMKEVNDLIKLYPDQLTLVDLPLEDKENLFSYQKNVDKKKHCVYRSDGKYNGKSISEMSNDALNAYKTSPDGDWEKSQHEAEQNGDIEQAAYYSEILRSLNIAEFFKQYAGANDEEIKQWFAFSGYNLYHSDITSSIWVKDGGLYDSSQKYQKFIKQGYMELVNCMLQDAMDNYGDKLDVNMLCNVFNIEKRGDGTLTFEVQHKPSKKREIWTAKKIILSLTKPQIKGIKGLHSIISEDRAGAIDSCKSIPLFKCFLNYDEKDNWWDKQGWTAGKTTYDDHMDKQSNLSTRQIHYYDPTTLLLYCSDGEKPTEMFATKCKRHFERNGEELAYKEMFKLVKDLHKRFDGNLNISEPIWEQCSYAYWFAGSHKWKKNVDILKCQQLIENGNIDGSNIYIMGDAFSSLQGWTEGCVETGNRAINYMCIESM